jgi:hypothetical protein
MQLFLYQCLNWIDKEKQVEKYQFVKDLFTEVQKQFEASKSTNAQKSPLMQKSGRFAPTVSPSAPIRPQVMQHIFALDSHFMLISTLVLCTYTS